MRRALALLLLLLLAPPAAAQGLAPVTRLLESLVPGLRVEGLTGGVSSRPAFTRLTLSDSQGVWLEIADGSISWSPTALVRRRLEVEELTAARVTVFRAPVSDAPAPTGPQPPGQVVPALPQLPVAVRLDRLALERIELAEPLLGRALALRATGGLRLDDGGLDLSLDTLLIDGGATLTLRAALRPATGRLTANAVLRGDAGGPLSRAAGLGDRPLSLELDLDGPADGAALRLAADAGDRITARLSGTIAAPDTSRLSARLTGTADAAGLVAGPLAELAGPFDIRLDVARLPDGLIEVRDLRLAGPPGVATAEGRLDPERDRTSLRLRAALPSSSVFAALVPDIAGWDALETEAEVTGPLAAPTIAAELRPAGLRSSVAPLAALLGPQPRATLRATLPDRIELLTISGQAMQAELRGRVGDTLDLIFAADIAAPGEAVPGLTGALTLRGTASGPATDPSVTLAAQSQRLEAAGIAVEALSLDARIATPASRPDLDLRATATLQELPLSVVLRATPEGEWVILQSADATLGPARLSARGRANIAARLAEGEATLAAGDLAPLARLVGRPLSGAIRLEARGDAREGRQHLAARLAVPRLATAGVEARDLAATVEGNLAALDLAASGTVNAVAAELRARLTEQPEGARRLDIAALRATAAGETVRLAAPARITLRPDNAIEVAQLTLALPRSGTLRAEGSWGPERADLRATLAAVNLAAFAPLVPDLAPAGTVTGEARVTGPTAAPELAATLRGTGLRAAIPAARGLPAGEARVELRRAGDGAVSANAEARLGPQQRLVATARFPRGPAADAPFEGTLDGALDLGPLTSTFLAAGADRVAGRLTLALRASGSLAAPQLGGEARVANGAYRNAVRGIAITDIAGTLRPDGPRLRADIAGRTPGEGRITLTGTVEPFTQFLPLDLALTATNATPISSDLVRATLDADLRLVGTLGQEARLTGPIRARRIEIRVPERLGGLRTLEPVIERGAPPGRAPRPAPPRRTAPTVPDTGPPIFLGLEVEAPRNVYVRGRGLDVELGGRLAVAGRVAQPEITGALEMRRGDVTVIGRRLTFERGRLAWTGGLLPDLALRATSEVGGVTARLDVTGPPTQPEIVFSSTPELPQDEIAARILFDRPLRELSPFEIAQIASALAGAAGLPGGEAAGFIDRLRQGLALDRLAVVSNSERAGRSTGEQDRAGAALEAGRYVAEGVYVGVRQGSEPGNTRVGVRVDLTPRIRLEAETGDREAGSRLGVGVEWQWGR